MMRPSRDNPLTWQTGNMLTVFCHDVDGINDLDYWLSTEHGGHQQLGRLAKGCGVRTLILWGGCYVKDTDLVDYTWPEESKRNISRLVARCHKRGINVCCYAHNALWWQMCRAKGIPDDERMWELARLPGKLGVDGICLDSDDFGDWTYELYDFLELCNVYPVVAHRSMPPGHCTHLWDGRYGRPDIVWVGENGKPAPPANDIGDLAWWEKWVARPSVKDPQIVRGYKPNAYVVMRRHDWWFPHVLWMHEHGLHVAVRLWKTPNPTHWANVDRAEECFCEEFAEVVAGSDK